MCDCAGLGLVLDAALSTLCCLSCCCCTRCCRRSFPKNVDQITPTWLTSVLRENNELEPERSVTSIDMRLVGEGDKGMTSVLAFLSLQFDGTTNCPSKICAKMNLADPVMRILFKLTKMVDREAGFLRLNQQNRQEQVIRTPKLYAAEIDRYTQDFLLLLEDLRPARPGSQQTGCTVEEVEAILSLLAVLHAHYWENYQQACSDVRGLVRPDDKSQAFEPMIIGGAWGKFEKWAKSRGLHLDCDGTGTTEGDGLSVAKGVMDEVVASKAGYQAAMSTAPLTVVHGDCHCENFMFKNTGELDEELIALDWQLCRVGQAAFDVANCLVMSLPLQLFKSKGNRLVEYYYAQLGERLEGGLQRLEQQGFTLDECHNRFQAGLCYTLVLEVVGQSLADEKELANEVTQSKRQLVFQRILGALRQVDGPTIFFGARCSGNSSGGGSAAPVATAPTSVSLLPTAGEDDSTM